ncbi:ABC transporter ATP-binding protein [Nocardioides sp.]|uniref:ABC transporter ATP-binding protein n=1 Tax=Nocardioides sp. TaxID=35761 RepID=UPI003568E20B
MSHLELREVTHRYAGTPDDAVTEVTITVPDGEMVSIVGPSGSGKTTLLRVAAGLESPRSGRVVLDGVDVTSLPTERRDLTVMFQQPHLFEHLNVAGNVGFAPRLAGSSRREARRCAERYLRLVHLTGFDRRRVGSLSGGQQQRVALARALAAERGVMLLDEPFSSLDRELRASMHDLLAEVRAAISPTIVMVTHDLDEAGLADSTVVLVDGVVHQQGATPVLYREPATLEVARLVGGFTEIVGRVEGGVHNSAWGRVPISPACRVEGPGLLLLRREDLRLRPAHDQLSGASPGLSGRVTRIRQSGARQVVTVSTAGGSDVEAEVRPDPAFSMGSQVTLSPRSAARGWVLPVPDQPAGAHTLVHA